MSDANPDVIADPERLACLRRLRLLDTPADPAFDRLTQLVARILKVPIALVSLIDDQRQFFKSQVGLVGPWTSIHSYCKQVVITQCPLIIEDARKELLVSNNGGTLGSGVLAYAGVPLITSDGFALGALCVIDTRPRSWTDEQITILDDLSKSVMTEIELRSELIKHEEIETALRKSEQHLQAVIGGAPVIVYVVDREGKFLISDGKGLEVIQVKPNRIAGRSVYEIYASQPEIIRCYQRALAGETLSTLTSQQTPIGLLYYEARFSPLYDLQNQVIGAVAVATDVTIQVLAEKTLERSVDRLTLLRRIQVELSESLDLNSVLTIAMDTAQRASGAEHGFIGVLEGNRLRMVQVAGSYVKDFTFDFNQGIIGRALRTRQPQFVLDVDSDPDFVNKIPGVRAQMAIPLINRDHLVGVLSLETAISGLFTREGFDFLGLIAGPITVAIDNAQLYQISQQQLEELHALYTRVSDLEQLKTDMIRIAAHDLRNPLGGVKGYAEMLLMENGDPLTDDQRSYVESIAEAGLKMLMIIEGILSLERIEATQNNHPSDEIDLVDLTRTIYGENEPHARDKGQTYRLTLPDAPLFVCVDRAQLREAIDNLIGNAIKYTPDGGSVTVRLKPERDRLVFEVEDSGLGIPENQQERLFQPFFRASNAKASEIEGTGLGLHLVRNIIERHGGKMHFRSALGQGSLFGFELPLQRA